MKVIIPIHKNDIEALKYSIPSLVANLIVAENGGGGGAPLKREKLEFIIIGAKEIENLVLSPLQAMIENGEFEKAVLNFKNTYGNKSSEYRYSKLYTDFIPSDPYIPNIKFIDEDNMIENLSLQKVKEEIISIIGEPTSAGWYFQQFLKMGFAKICDDEFYLAWDSELVLLNPIEVKDRDGIATLFYWDLCEAIAPHFKRYSEFNKFLNLKILPFRDVNSICDFMIFSTTTMREILGLIGSEDIGKNVISKISKKYLKENLCAFSEYDLYMNYVARNDIYNYNFKNLIMFRTVLEFFPKDRAVANAYVLSKDFDLINLDKYTGLARGNFVFNDFLLRKIGFKNCFRLRKVVLKIAKTLRLA